jgi:hypothetical protein
MITTYHLIVSIILTAGVVFNGISLRARSKNWIYSILWICVAIFIGLRFEVGGDWSNYLRKFDKSQGESLAIITLINKDIGYSLIIFLAHKFNVGIWLPNLVCALLFVSGFRKLNLTSSQPLLFLFICLPYIIIIIGMGYTRQSAAIGCGILALTYFYERKFYRSLFYYLLAISFHKFAAIIIIIVLPYSLLLLGVVIFALFFQKVSESVLFANYILSDYVDAAKGAELRATITLVAGIYALCFCKHMPHIYKDLLIKTSYLSFVLFVLSFHFETAIDRIGLYFIYLQPLALSEFNVKNKKILNSALFLCIMLSYFALLLIWFAISDNVHTWVPYRFYI